MSQSEIHEVELTIEHAKELIEKGRMAEKLSNIPEFRKIVLEGYFVEEAARLVHLFSDPSIPAEVRAYIERDLAGPGAFKRYLSTIVRMGQNAQQELIEAQETLDDIRNEGGDE